MRAEADRGLLVAAAITAPERSQGHKVTTFSLVVIHRISADNVSYVKLDIWKQARIAPLSQPSAYQRVRINT